MLSEKKIYKFELLVLWLLYIVRGGETTYICFKSVSHNDIVENSDYHNSIFSEADESSKK